MSVTSAPVVRRPSRKAWWSRGDDTRQSRPRASRRCPLAARWLPMARPRSRVSSSEKSRSATPRKSYSRKTRGFMSGELLFSRQVGDDVADVLGAVARHDEDGVAGADDDQARDADERDEPGVGGDDVVASVDGDHAPRAHVSGGVG